MKKLEIVFALFRLAQAPSDYSRVEKFRAILRKHGYFTFGVNQVQANPATRPVMNAKPLLDWSSVDLEKLKSLPRETLGYQYVQFLEKNKLDHLTYSQDTKLTDEEYFLRRVIQTHDLCHVVLGYETDELGEIGINSFMLAQIGWPPAGFYIGGYVLRQMFKAPHRIGEVIATISEGWIRGKHSRPLFAIPWKSQLNKPLEEIRNGIKLPDNGFPQASTSLAL